MPPTVRPTMRRALRAGIAASLVPLLALGCNDLLVEEPRGFLSPDNLYRTAADADAAVLGIYEPLSRNEGGWRARTVALEAGSDQARVGPLEPFADYRLTGQLLWDSQTSTLGTMWNVMYDVVTRANVNVQKVPGVPMDTVRRAQLVGEAKFLRALAYFNMVRVFGGVPLITSPDQDGFTPRRAPADSVYRQIVADLQDAARALPNQATRESRGRATRGSALAMLADVHLTRREWQQAADAARQVIDLGVYSLFPNYLDAFLPATENGVEHVFSLQAEGPATVVGSGYVAAYYPRQLVAGQGGGNGSIVPTTKQYNSYVAGDYRRDVTYRTQWTNARGQAFTLDPHVAKYRPTQVTQVFQGDVNIPVYRYADVLLMEAEALNELGRTADAIGFVNQVRARARRGTGSENRAQPANLPAGLDQAALREAIYMERSWELAHESKRWFDLVRRGQDYFLAQMAMDPEATGLKPHNILWPIPQAQIDLNRNIEQNPGY